MADGVAITAANQTTIIGHVDGIEGLLTTIDADTGALAACAAGTWTVQPGNTANTTPWLTTNTPAASGGANLSVPAPDWLFATASATLLNLNLSSANAVHWSVSYYDEA